MTTFDEHADPEEERFDAVLAGARARASSRVANVGEVYAAIVLGTEDGFNDFETHESTSVGPSTLLPP